MSCMNGAEQVGSGPVRGPRCPLHPGPGRRPERRAAGQRECQQAGPQWNVQRIDLDRAVAEGPLSDAPTDTAADVADPPIIAAVGPDPPIVAAVGPAALAIAPTPPPVLQLAAWSEIDPDLGRIGLITSAAFAARLGDSTFKHLVGIELTSPAPTPTESPSPTQKHSPLRGQQPGPGRSARPPARPAGSRLRSERQLTRRRTPVRTRQVEWLGRAPQMSEYPIDDRLHLDAGNHPESSAAAPADGDVDLKHPLQPLRPAHGPVTLHFGLLVRLGGRGYLRLRHHPVPQRTVCLRADGGGG